MLLCQLSVTFQPGIGHCSTRKVRPRALTSASSGTNTSSNITRLASMPSCGLRPTKPVTASAPRSTAASSTRNISAYFLRRMASSGASMLPKYARSESPTPLARIARATRAARSCVNGCRRSSVLATGSSIAAAGISVSVGWSAADSSMLGQPSVRANSSHSSMARSASASRCLRGVSSCSAAVRMLSRMGRGRKARTLSAVRAGSLLGGIRDSLVAEHRCKKYQHRRRKARRVQPDCTPVVDAARKIRIVNQPRNREADQHAHAVGGERDQSLGGAAVRGPGLRVGVYLPGHKEKVVTRPVERNADDEHERELMCVAEGKEDVAAHPRQHSEQQRHFHAKGAQQRRDRQHEKYFRHLSDGLLAGGIGDADLGEELVGVLIVERERYADQNRGDEEHQKVPLPQQSQRLETDEAPEPQPVCRGRQRRSRRQGETV